MMRALAVAFCIAVTSPAVAADVIGRATVVDADTVDIGDVRVRFWGADGFESSQLCKSAAGADYRCGQIGAFALADKIAGKVLRCTQYDLETRYAKHRVIGICRIGREDVAGWLVSNGHALAYRHNRYYSLREETARRAKRGVHAGTFCAPADYRARRCN